MAPRSSYCSEAVGRRPPTKGLAVPTMTPAAAGRPRSDDRRYTHRRSCPACRAAEPPWPDAPSSASSAPPSRADPPPAPPWAPPPPPRVPPQSPAPPAKRPRETRSPRPPAPPALHLRVPENVDDLKNLEKQVKTVVDKVTPATVGLQVG